MKLPAGFMDECVAAADKMVKIDRLIDNRDTFIAVLAKLGVMAMRGPASFPALIEALHDHLLLTADIDLSTVESIMLSFSTAYAITASTPTT